MKWMQYGTLGFAQLLHEDEGRVRLDAMDTPLALVLDRTDDEVVAADLDTLCRRCAFTAARALGAIEETAAVSYTGDASDASDAPEPVLRLTGADGTVYIGTYGYGRTDQASAPCTACGKETLLPWP